MTDATSHFNVHAFRNALVEWFRREGKDYPWRRTTDPWHILVSELMLQQTTIPTVLGRYDRWMRQFPTPGHLAAVDEQTALRSWEGLGADMRGSGRKNIILRYSLRTERNGKNGLSSL